MVADLDRRDLLRGRFASSPDGIRPPGAIDEQEFRLSCSRCNDCTNACPNQIIKADHDGRPVLDFSQAECVFCGDCERACSTGALKTSNERPWQVVANIQQNCLSLNGVACRSCADHCEEQAITFKLMIGGRSQPLLHEDHCTGCGACVSSCPTKSINMVHRPNIQPDQTNLEQGIIS